MGNLPRHDGAEPAPFAARGTEQRLVKTKKPQGYQTLSSTIIAFIVIANFIIPGSCWGRFLSTSHNSIPSSEQNNLLLRAGAAVFTATATERLHRDDDVDKEAPAIHLMLL